jgi:O-antigen/teichoic acid export membrane protein
MMSGKGSPPVMDGADTRPRPSLIENIMALGALQISSYVIPVLTAAYSARVLGSEAWGRVALVQVVLTYFTLVISWGFSWSATRKIASLHDDNGEISRVAVATMAAQAVLAAAMAVLLAALVATSSFFARDAAFYLWGVGVLAAAAVFPTWLLTGLERMREFSAIQIAARILTLGLVVILVRKPADAPLMIAANAIAGLFAGAVTLVWLFRSSLISWRTPSLSQIAEQLREGAAIFASTSMTSLYVNLTPVILGALMGPVATGYYVMADRIRLAAQSVLAPVSNALFPRISRLVTSDPALTQTILARSGAAILVGSALISLVLFLGADRLSVLVGGEAFRPAGQVLRWLALLPFIMSFSTFFGLQVLLPNQRNRAFNLILGSAGVLSLAIIVPLIEWGGVEGAAISICLVETFVSAAMIIYLARTGYFTGRWDQTAYES